MGEARIAIATHIRTPAVPRTLPAKPHCSGATDDSRQPLPLSRDWLVRAPPPRLFGPLELRSHAVRSGLPFDLEFARAGLAADKGEAEEVEGLRFAETASLAAFCREASELDEPGLLGMQGQRKLP